MKLTRLFTTILVSAVCLTYGANAQDVSKQVMYVTGLRPPTPPELEWMDKNLIKTAKVKLNKLALDRINVELASSGLQALNIPPAPDGAEVLAVGEQDYQRLDLAGGNLPAAVDNSTLPSFPPVRNQGSIGSCACFSSGYYVGTHMLGMARGFNRWRRLGHHLSQSNRLRKNSC